MAIDTWPNAATLPQRFQTESYRESVPDNRIKTPTDTGPGFSRARSSTATYMISGNMEMTGTQWASLLTFLRTTLRECVLPFNFPSPSDYTGATLLQVQIGQNVPERSALGGDNFLVHLEFEVLP